MLDQREIKDLLARRGAVVTNDHFVYTSGKHGPAYINKDAVYPHTHDTAALCRTLASSFVRDCVEVVVAPAVGAVILSQWVAYFLTTLTSIEVLGIYADKGEDDTFVIKRGYDKLIPDKRVLVVEDLFTTGGSVLKVVDAVRALGGIVVGVAGLANRGGVTAHDVGDVPRLVTLLDVRMEMYEPHECPLCKSGIPVNTQLGHGKKFLAAKQPA
jgi:orotate phosphoribosyltransferase